MAFKLRNPFAAKSADKSSPELMERDAQQDADNAGRLSTNMTIERQTAAGVGADAPTHVVQHNESDMELRQAANDEGPETATGDALSRVVKTRSNIQNNRMAGEGEAPVDSAAEGRGPVRLDPTPARAAEGSDSPPTASGPGSGLGIEATRISTREPTKLEYPNRQAGAGDPTDDDTDDDDLPNRVVVRGWDPEKKEEVAANTGEVEASAVADGRDRLRVVPTSQTTGREDTGADEPGGIAIGEPGVNGNIAPADLGSDAARTGPSYDVKKVEGSRIGATGDDAVDAGDPVDDLAAKVAPGGRVTGTINVMKANRMDETGGDGDGIAVADEGTLSAAERQKMWHTANFRQQAGEMDEDDEPSILLDLSGVSDGSGAVAITDLAGDGVADLADLDSDGAAVEADDLTVDS